MFVTAPDVVGNHFATIQKSKFLLQKIRLLGFKVAFVAQDGATKNNIDWSSFDCLFIGGTTKWKLSEYASNIVQEAKAKDKWVHMGRVNSYKRMRVAQAIGVDSVDVTSLAFAPDKNTKDLLTWIARINKHPCFIY